VAIISLYKSLGATPLQALDALRVERPEFVHEPMTYAGRLDPLAEGVLIVLTGEDRYRAKEFQQLGKTYRATFVFGFSSDTGDVLGMVDRSEFFRSIEHVQEIREILLGDHDVQLPVYSSYKVKGSPLHAWAKSNRLDEIEIPRRVMHVDAVRNVDIETMSAEMFLRSVLEKIATVFGDFRQEAIVRRWKEIMHGVDDVILVSCELDVHSGTYIRSLSGVLGERLGTGALLYSLVRTRVGEFS
jgi:tRNA pseudouridine55 synthase